MSANLPQTDMAAVIAGELAALAADAKTLAARLRAGDVVSAVVLPSNGLTDLLDIGGLRVAAELPPNLLPGETVTVRVVSFLDDRINLQVIDTEPGPQRASLPPPVAAPPAAERIRAAVRRPVVVPAAQAVPVVAPRPAGLPPVPAGQTAIEARLAATHAMHPAAAKPAPALPSAVRPLITMRPAAALGAAPAVVRELAGFSDPAELLRGLQLPVTATNVALARMALDAPDKLPNALSTLGRALRDSADPRLSTLDALVTFVAKLDPRSPVLATQIASYVDHVVTGREAKIVQLLGGAEDTAAAVTGERVAAGWAALDFDLKSQLLALAAPSAAATHPAALGDAVTGALTALTAVQLKAAAAPPDGLSFTLPMALPDGSVPARVRIRRDRRETVRAPIETAELSVSLAMDTRTLGPVTVEIATAGRGLKLNVAAGDDASRQRLERGLEALRARLEELDYRLDAATVAVAAAPAPRTAAVAESMRHVDVDA